MVGQRGWRLVVVSDYNSAITSHTKLFIEVCKNDAQGR